MREKNHITCRLKEIVKNCGNCYFHTRRDPEAPFWLRDRHIFTLYGKQSFSSQETSSYSLDLRGVVRNGYTDQKEVRSHNGESWEAYCDVFEPSKGFWSLASATDFLRAAIESVPEDAEVSFEVILDGGTHDMITKFNLHVDQLIMKVKYTRGHKEYNREFLIDTMVTKHNMNRFGQPGSKFY